jgi:hypothetical protein
MVYMHTPAKNLLSQVQVGSLEAACDAAEAAGQIIALSSDILAGEPVGLKDNRFL